MLSHFPWFLQAECCRLTGCDVTTTLNELNLVFILRQVFLFGYWVGYKKSYWLLLLEALCGPDWSNKAVTWCVENIVNVLIWTRNEAELYLWLVLLRLNFGNWPKVTLKVSYLIDSSWLHPMYWKVYVPNILLCRALVFIFRGQNCDFTRRFFLKIVITTTYNCCDCLLNFEGYPYTFRRLKCGHRLLLIRFFTV